MIKLIKYQNLILLTSLVCLPVFFQNCSVKTSDNSLQVESKNRAPKSTNSSDSASTGVSTNIKTCSINNQVYKPGDTVLGYVTNSAVSPAICGDQISRKCLDTGFFDISSPLYTSCNQQCLHPDSSQVMNSGSNYVYYTKKSGTSQADCDAARKTSTCSGEMPSMGTYVPAIPTTRYTTCLVSGQTCAYTITPETAIPTGYIAKATVKGFASASATFPTLCGTQKTLTCQSTGSWGGSIPLYSACIQKCIHPDSKQPVDQNSTFVYYTAQSGTQSQCNAAKVTATCSASTGQFVVNGTTTGAVPTSRFANCNIQSAPTITSFSATPSSIANGSSTSLSWSTMNATQIKLNNVDVTGTSIKSVSPTVTTVYTLSAINTLGTVTATTTVTVTAAPVDPLMGRALYDSKCSACHGAFDVSTLKGRVVTADKISNSMVTISAMSFLKGSMTTAQLTSIENLFTTVVDPGTGTTTSGFACSSTEAEKNSSLNLIRLTGAELKNTYQTLIPTSVWTGLSAYYYLLPVDNFEGLITNFVSTYNADYVEQISRFNEQIANQIVASSANISSFFGSCASSSSFPKTCFDSFLTSRGPLFFRSALASDDNATLWASVTKATSVADQLKILIQLVFNDPRFLYHLELGDGTAATNGLLALNSYEIANRISYGMTAAPADSTLWADATSNKLKNLTTITAHVDRISKTTAFKNRIIEFVKFYVGLSVTGTAPLVTEFMNGINGTGLDVAATNEFNEYINYIVFTQNGTLNDLLTSQAAFPKTSTLATIMGTSVWSSGAPLTAVNHPGLLAKPYMQLVSNPNLKLVQRGRRIRMNMLCTDVPQPSAADLAARPNLSANDLVVLNRRQYIEKATMTGASCIACHSKMNQLGYATENYDSIGRYITTEKIYNSTDVKVAEHPVVSTTTPSIIETDMRTFNGLKEVEIALAQSDTMQQCLSRKTFQFFLRKQEDLTNDSCRLNKMDTQIKTGMPLLNFFVENFKQQSMMYKRSN